MSEVIKYSAIKLFGTTISLPPDKGFTAACHLQQLQSFSSSITSISRDYIKIDSEGELTGTKREDLATKPAAETLIEPATSADITDDPKTLGKDSSSPKTRNTEEPSESDVSQEKTPKKPDKILPCPRCKSMDTKFCYFNNYNVNQPRHFCKLCKRYWTSGGTMRNVPVGSGRCKNRNASSSIYGHVIVQDTLQAAQASLKPIGSVLMFGSESPLCDPMTSPTLGKHSRDGNIILIDSNSFVLRANPAALSRSFNFRESV